MKNQAKSVILALGLAMGAGLAAQAETLRVGAYAANPPWEVKQTDGSFEGFEVDLITEIANRIGADLTFEDLGFQALFAATSSGRIDVAISTITITDERLQNQSFTQGYYDADLALATATDSPVTGLADLEGKVVGVLSTSTGETWANEKMAEYGFSEVKGYNAQQDLLLDTQLGRADGAISDITGMQYAFQNMPKMHIVERIPSGDQYGLMMSKDHPMLGAVNDAISAMKQDGTMLEIYHKWFGADAEPGPSTIDVLEIPTAG
jgi:polar amino acid transport system substrate-binding protein